MVLGSLLKIASPLVSLISSMLGSNIVYDWNSVVRDVIGHLKRWTPVMLVTESQSYHFWHTNLNICGAPPAFPGEQYAYDRMIPPVPEAGQVQVTPNAQRAAQQNTRGLLGAPGDVSDPNCPKAIINDNIPSLLLVVVVVLRGQEALIPPADPQWQTFPINSVSSGPFSPYYNGGDSPIWAGEQQLIDGKVVYCTGAQCHYEFAGGFTSGEWPSNRLSNVPKGTMVHVVYKGSDNIVIPEAPKLTNRVLGYVAGLCSYQPLVQEPNVDAPTDFSQSQ